MLSKRCKLLVRFVSAAGLLLGAVGSANAGPYYTATDLGNLGFSVNPQSVLPFPNSFGTLPESDFASRPGAMAWFGTLNSTLTFFPMQVTDYNSAGTVIGEVPSGASRAIPTLTPSIGYAVVSPQGQWSGFTVLSSGFNGPPGIVELSSLSNQILVTDNQGSRLVNPVDGSSTPISQLVDPSVLAQYSMLSGQGIDARGDILAYGIASDGNAQYLVLSPPGIAAPPIPEPTTLATLTVAAAGVALRRWLRKSHRPV